MATNICEENVENIYFIKNDVRKKAKDFEIREEKNFSYMDVLELTFESEDGEKIKGWEIENSKLEIETLSGIFSFDDIIPGAHFGKENHHEIIYIRNLPLLE